MNTQQSVSDWYQLVDDGASQRLVLTGNLTLAALDKKFGQLSRELSRHARNTDICWDLSQIQHMDTAGIVLLWNAWCAKRPNRLILRPEHEKMLRRIENLPAEIPESRKRSPFWPIQAIGGQFLLLWENLIGMIMMVGQLALDSLFFCAILL